MTQKKKRCARCGRRAELLNGLCGDCSLEAGWYDK